MFSKGESIRTGALILAGFLVGSSSLQAETERERYQRGLNEQVLSQPFSVPDEGSLNNALGAATERGRPTRVPTGSYGGYPYYGGGYPYYGGYYSPYSYGRYSNPYYYGSRAYRPRYYGGYYGLW
jgi:hypothetical protein